MLRQHRKNSSWLLAISLSVILSFVFAGSAFAVEFRGGDSVTISQNEVIDDDLVLTGDTVIVDGVIQGDLVVAASKVIINGTVNGSLMMAGRMLEINGQIDGTVYSAGAALTIGSQATIARSLFFGGYSYTAALGSVINRDNVIGGYQANLNGEVKRNLLAGLGALQLNGKIGGDVTANVAAPSETAPQFWSPWLGDSLPPSINPGLYIGPEAQISGKLLYISPIEQSGAINMRPAGGVIYSTPQLSNTSTMPVAAPITERNPMIEWGLARLRELVSLLLIGGLTLWLIPALFTSVAERTQLQPWFVGAWGILVGITAYVGAGLAVILLILLVAGLGIMTLGGLAASTFGLGFSALGLVFTLFSLLAAYGSKLLVLYPLSQHLLARLAPQLNQYKVVPLLLGVLVFVLLRSIPYLGILLEIGVTLVGLGAMWLSFRERYAKPAAPPLVLAPA